MCDYEELILKRQEAIEIFENYSCPGCCKQCEFVDLCYEEQGKDEPFDYDLCFGCDRRCECNDEVNR